MTIVTSEPVEKEYCKDCSGSEISRVMLKLKAGWRDSLVVSMLDERSRGRGSSLAAAGGRVATVSQLLFAPFGVGKWVPVTAG